MGDMASLKMSLSGLPLPVGMGDSQEPLWGQGEPSFLVRVEWSLGSGETEDHLLRTWKHE